MTPIQRLETDILTLHERISLRPTLDLAAQIGERLQQAKKLLPHGQWLPWLTRCGIAPRTAQTYIQIANAPTPAHFRENLTIEQFIRTMRLARIEGQKTERKERRADLLSRTITHNDDVTITHTDARQYQWPRLDILYLDPPWNDMGLYQWGADLAEQNLNKTGFLLVQCGQTYLPNVFQIFSKLEYIWTLAVVYPDGNHAESPGMIGPCWRPLILFSKGAKLKERMNDVVTSRKREKHLHPWQQELGPLTHWLGKLTIPGQLVGDPFACTATAGVAAQANHLRYIGTEIDRENCEVGRARLTTQPHNY